MFGLNKCQVCPPNEIVPAYGVDESLTSWISNACMEERKLSGSPGAFIDIGGSHCAPKCDGSCGRGRGWQRIGAAMEWYHVKITRWVSGSGEALLVVMVVGSKLALQPCAQSFGTEMRGRCTSSNLCQIRALPSNLMSARQSVVLD